MAEIGRKGQHDRRESGLRGVKADADQHHDESRQRGCEDTNTFGYLLFAICYVRTLVRGGEVTRIWLRGSISLNKKDKRIGKGRSWKGQRL